MKKITLLSIMMFIGFVSQAQIGLWVGGVGMFNSTTTDFENDLVDDPSLTQGAFGPSVGYMLGERAAVGINLMFTGSTFKENNDVNEETKMSGYMIEPLFRYYSGNEGNFKFFGDLKVGFGGGTTTMSEDNQEDQESKYSSFGVNVAPGMQYWFNDSWSILATVGQLGYNSNTQNVDEANQYSDNTFGLQLDFSTINFALFWHL